MALWEQIKQKHENRKQNVASSNTDPNLLYNLLTQDKVNSGNSGGFGSSEGNLGDGLTNIAKAAKTFMGSKGAGTSMPSQYGFSNLGSLAASTGSGSSVPSQYSFDSLSSLGSSSSSVPSQYGFDSFLTNSGSTGATSSAASGATKTGGLFGGSGGSGGGSNVPWAMIAKVAKEGYNGISGHDDEEYSDVEESVIYPLQGAAMGSKFGPWGAAGGALYGLGYSFKDDLGMKDSNFLTQMLFPIGMGDGGGLRISGKPILDLG
jgi:hypothetical protein